MPPFAVRIFVSAVDGNRPAFKRLAGRSFPHVAPHTDADASEFEVLFWFVVLFHIHYLLVFVSGDRLLKLFAVMRSLDGFISPDAQQRGEMNRACDFNLSRLLRTKRQLFIVALLPSGKAGRDGARGEFHSDKSTIHGGGRIRSVFHAQIHCLQRRRHKPEIGAPFILMLDSPKGGGRCLSCN